MLGAFAGVKKFTMGGSPGLVVMGGDSRSKGRGFRIPVPDTGWT